VYFELRMQVADHILTSLYETVAKVKVELPINEYYILCLLFRLADIVAFPARISIFFVTSISTPGLIQVSHRKEDAV
jgi:hypothetical protein